MELIDDGGLPDAGVAGNENEFRPATGYNTVERGEQGIDFRFSSVQFLGNQQSVWRVLFAQWEFVDAMMRFPFSKAAPKIARSTGRCLVSLLSSLGKQLHDDCRNRARNTLQPLAWRHRLSRDMTVHPFHRIGRREWKNPGHQLVKRHAESIQVASRIDRAI